MLLIISVIFLLAASLVVICILVMGKLLTKGAVAQMNLFCDERGSDLDTELLRIEDELFDVPFYPGMNAFWSFR